MLDLAQIEGFDWDEGNSRKSFEKQSAFVEANRESTAKSKGREFVHRNAFRLRP